MDLSVPSHRSSATIFLFLYRDDVNTWLWPRTFLPRSSKPFVSRSVVVVPSGGRFWLVFTTPGKGMGTVLRVGEHIPWNTMRLIWVEHVAWFGFFTTLFIFQMGTRVGSIPTPRGRGGTDGIMETNSHMEQEKKTHGNGNEWSSFTPLPQVHGLWLYGWEKVPSAAPSYIHPSTDTCLVDGIRTLPCVVDRRIPIHRLLVLSSSNPKKKRCEQRTSTYPSPQHRFSSTLPSHRYLHRRDLDTIPWIPFESRW